MTTKRKFLVWSVKGGVGKTNLSAELCLRLKYPDITNEIDSMLSRILPAGRLKVLGRKEPLPKLDCGVIFDFAGNALDMRIIDALDQCHYAIIPTTSQASELQGCINTIKELEKDYGHKIVVVANRTKKKESLTAVLNVICKIGKFPIFEIKESTALPNIYLRKKSISKMMEDNPLMNYHYKIVSDQFGKLCEHLLKPNLEVLA